MPIDMEFQAGIAQLVEYKLPKLGVAGSNPVARSNPLSIGDRTLSEPFLRLPLRFWRWLTSNCGLDVSFLYTFGDPM